jgi:hypothetical protein
MGYAGAVVLHDHDDRRPLARAGALAEREGLRQRAPRSPALCRRQMYPGPARAPCGWRRPKRRREGARREAGWRRRRRRTPPTVSANFVFQARDLDAARRDLGQLRVTPCQLRHKALGCHHAQVEQVVGRSVCCYPAPEHSDDEAAGEGLVAHDRNVRAAWALGIERGVLRKEHLRCEGSQVDKLQPEARLVTVGKSRGLSWPAKGRSPRSRPR